MRAFGPLRITFPTAPQRVLMIMYTEPATATIEGRRAEGTVTGDKSRDAIAPYRGQWRIVVGEVGRRGQRLE